MRPPVAMPLPAMAMPGPSRPLSFFESSPVGLSWKRAGMNGRLPSASTRATFRVVLLRVARVNLRRLDPHRAVEIDQQLRNPAGLFELANHVEQILGAPDG